MKNGDSEKNVEKTGKTTWNNDEMNGVIKDVIVEFAQNRLIIA